VILTKNFRFAYIPLFIVVGIGIGGIILRAIDAIRNGTGFYSAGVGLLIALPLALLIGWLLNRYLSRQEQFEEVEEKIDEDMLAKLSDEALKEHREGRTENLDPDKL
jgi:hypothetical protein